MQVIPAIDVERGRSRVVFWPGVSSGVGAPTDRPDRIAEHFVSVGAPLIHIVDFDGARAGSPMNLETVGADGPRLFAYACEATRAGIRMQHPGASPEQVERLLRERLELGRRLQELDDERS